MLEGCPRALATPGGRRSAVVALNGEAHSKSGGKMKRDPLIDAQYGFFCRPLL